LYSSKRLAKGDFHEKMALDVSGGMVDDRVDGRYLYGPQAVLWPAGHIFSMGGTVSPILLSSSTGGRASPNLCSAAGLCSATVAVGGAAVGSTRAGLLVLL
jgi:hypothetical protein